MKDRQALDLVEAMLNGEEKLKDIDQLVDIVASLSVSGIQALEYLLTHVHQEDF